MKTKVKNTLVDKPKKNARGQARQEQILNEAVEFFAENGFEGQTRELAKRLGITHTALYRHFENKEALIEAVYQRVYLDRWDPNWDKLVVDRSRSLEERLQEFYVSYAERVFDYKWVRIFVYAGLKDNGLPPRYLNLIRERIIFPIIEELSEESVLGTDPDNMLQDEEALWALHGSIFYIAIRRFIYGNGDNFNPNPVIRKTVSTYLKGLMRSN